MKTRVNLSQSTNDIGIYVHVGIAFEAFADDNDCLNSVPRIVLVVYERWVGREAAGL